MASENHLTLADEKMQYDFTPALRRKLILAMLIGVVMFAVGILLFYMGVGESSHGNEHALASGGEEGAGQHAYHWSKRVWVNLWLCTVYFTGISLVGVFFVAVNYVAWAGWSALIKRIPMAFGNFLPIMGVVMLILFLVAGKDIFHWRMDGITDPKNPNYDSIIAGKAGYLNFTFYLIRMVIYFAVWYILYRYIRGLSMKEDQLTDYRGYLQKPTLYNKAVYYSAVFIVFFAVSTSMAAWDWVMSIDPHWFSTMFGWYNFASWHVAGLATIALSVIYLKEQGYLKLVNKHHLHDLGKFMFAFSIFWSYIWVSQFLLIYYANIPEETPYWLARWYSPTYKGIFYLNIVINFAFPFLMLMTKESKRTMLFLKIVAIAILIGHYLDFYMMVMPGTIGEHSGFGLVEFGSILIFASAFIYVMASTLSQAPLIAKNHPFIKESMHFYQF